MNDQQLKTLFEEYNALVTTALQNSDPSMVDQITAKNQEIAAHMDELIRHTTMSGTTNPEVLAARDELVQKLTRIQRDYNGLIQNTDKLETLRRIRDFNQETAQGFLPVYLIAFLVLSIFLVIMIVMTKYQNIDTTPMMPSNPSTMPPFI